MSHVSNLMALEDIIIIVGLGLTTQWTTTYMNILPQNDLSVEWVWVPCTAYTLFDINQPQKFEIFLLLDTFKGDALVFDQLNLKLWNKIKLGLTKLDQLHSRALMMIAWL